MKFVLMFVLAAALAASGAGQLTPSPDKIGFKKFAQQPAARSGGASCTVNNKKLYTFKPSATPDMASYEAFKETWIFEEASSTGTNRREEAGAPVAKWYQLAVRSSTLVDLSALWRNRRCMRTCTSMTHNLLFGRNFQM
jgi:hypothetical protein